MGERIIKIDKYRYKNPQDAAVDLYNEHFEVELRKINPDNPPEDFSKRIKEHCYATINFIQTKVIAQSFLEGQRYYEEVRKYIKLI